MPNSSSKHRRLAAVMFTDIVGYTALMQQDEKAAADIRNRHRKAFQQNHDQYRGEIIQYFGDGTLSVFQSGVEAVECAVAIQLALQQSGPVPLRIGLHIGDIVFDGTDIYGDGVNVASRIESMGVAGSILLSGKLNDELKNHLDIATRSLGSFSLKNIAVPVDVFAVDHEGIQTPSRAELKGKQVLPAKSIAVLPLVNRSSGEENEYFTDGMTEEIINALSRIKNLKVTSRTSSFFFKNKNLPIRQIGRELNVSTILEGSIRLHGKKMRITAQLVDVDDDFHFWSETFDRPVDDVFAVQDEISLLIADKLREHLGHLDIEDHLVEAPDVPVDAYKRYLKGRYHILKMRRPDIEKGLSILEGVLLEQPRFALAHLGMHLGYTLSGTIGFIPAEEAFARGKAYLDQAIEIDPDLPECQLHLSYICFLQHWDLESTYRHLNKAFEIRPTVEFYQSMASTLLAEGKSKAALNYIETALQLDPLSSINYHLKGFVFYIEEQYKKAITCFEKSIELGSSFMVSRLYLGQALLLMGRGEEGLAFFQKFPEDEPGDVMRIGGTTLAHAALGHTEQAEAGIEKLESVLETDLIERALNLLILCQAMMGREDEMRQLVKKGIQLRLPMMVYLSVEPILKPFRSDPRFRKLIHQIFGETTDSPFSKRKYKQALFSKKELETCRRELTSLMEAEQPYLDPGLTLRELAGKMSLPSNHLSQLLNEGFDKNFAEYINSYRLEQFKLKAADPANRHLTLLALAYECGFNSKTVFNTYFKKTMGMTPSAYWKEVRSE